MISTADIGQTVLPAPPAPRAEGVLARLLRHARDRRHLTEMEGRLLRDVGLTRADVARGVPFSRPARP